MAKAKASFASKPWWSVQTVALVTGANRGIGHEIARMLGEQGLTVVVTSRGAASGRKAVVALQQAVPAGVFEYHTCDITDAASVAECARFVKGRFGEVHVLVNNAGVAFKEQPFGADKAQRSIDCNLRGTRAATEAMLPLMRRGARIVNVCSMSGRMKQLQSEQLRQAFLEPGSVEDIDKLCDAFVQAIRDGKHKEQGWSDSTYGVSKLAEISYTLLLATQLQDKGIVVTAVCPDWCQTPLSPDGATKTPAEGAEVAVWAALRPPEEAETGRFYQDRHEVSWLTG